MTDSEGQFSIKGLLPGVHSFRIWHESASFLDRAYKVTIQADTTTNVSLSFKQDDFKLP